MALEGVEKHANAVGIHQAAAAQVKVRHLRLRTNPCCELQHRWCATSVSKSFCPLYVVMIEIFEAEMPCAPPEGRKQRGRRVVG